MMRLLSTLPCAVLLACSATSEVSEATLGDPEEGRLLLHTYGCGACHRIPGVVGATNTIGPPLERWSERRYIAGRTLNTAEHLMHWIMAPELLDPGNAMPNLGVNAREARQMAAYLFTLR